MEGTIDLTIKSLVFNAESCRPHQVRFPVVATQLPVFLDHVW